MTKRIDPGFARHAPIAVRFWRLVDKSGECWRWTGSTTRGGYGQIRVGGKLKYVHRYSYEEANGPVPDGKEIDHLCKNTRCVRPSRLEAVTHAVNVSRADTGKVNNWHARKTHCPSGHPYDAANMYRTSTGGRICRTCHRLHARKRHGEATDREHQTKEQSC